MTPVTRKILRTYASGMGMPYRDVVEHFNALSTVQKFQALSQMRALEESWQQELRARGEVGFWRRLWARVKSRVNAWRLPTS